MNFLVVTHTNHIIARDGIYAYAPYVREMNIWGKHVDQISLVAPVSKNELTNIHAPYASSNITLSRIPVISLTSFTEFFRSIVLIPVIIFKIFKAMRVADHIHIRCPGNIGLLGCLVQIFFPNKPKTAKYAGNWDPKSKQPKSYKIQKWILSNTFLTKNMKVLVYGDWPNRSKNIVPFFTASYGKDMIPSEHLTKPREAIRFLFVGGLTRGKRPEYAVELVNSLTRLGHDCELDFYGDGIKRADLVELISKYGLEDRVALHGNVRSETVQKAYRSSHFLILPSKSEGWPKVVAEAMFWGCLPLVTPISCVPWMLKYGDRGILLTLNVDEDSGTIAQLISDEEKRRSMMNKAQLWSHRFTLDAFENEIIKFVS